ncbi:MAG: hypothetical protein WD872_04830 [Pirellulaceae bacterium]
MPDESSFQTILENGSVVIRKTSTYDIDDRLVEYIVVTVLDKRGRVADEFSSRDDEDSRAWELFQKARGAARSSEGIIARLLEEIG